MTSHFAGRDTEAQGHKAGVQWSQTETHGARSQSLCSEHLSPSSANPQSTIVGAWAPIGQIL